MRPNFRKLCRHHLSMAPNLNVLTTCVLFYFPILLNHTGSPHRWLKGGRPKLIHFRHTKIAERWYAEVLEITLSKRCCRNACFVMGLVAIRQAMLQGSKGLNTGPDMRVDPRSGELSSYDLRNSGDRVSPQPLPYSMAQPCLFHKIQTWHMSLDILSIS